MHSNIIGLHPELRRWRLTMATHRAVRRSLVKEAYERLVGSGHSKQEAKQLIAVVLSAEIYDMITTQSEYKHERYISRLNLLPQMPWEHE